MTSPTALSEASTFKNERGIGLRIHHCGLLSKSIVYGNKHRQRP